MLITFPDSCIDSSMTPLGDGTSGVIVQTSSGMVVAPLGSSNSVAGVQLLASVQVTPRSPRSWQQSFPKDVAVAPFVGIRASSNARLTSRPSRPYLRTERPYLRSILPHTFAPPRSFLHVHGFTDTRCFAALDTSAETRCVIMDAHGISGPLREVPTRTGHGRAPNRRPLKIGSK